MVIQNKKKHKVIKKLIVIFFFVDQYQLDEMIPSFIWRCIILCHF